MIALGLIVVAHLLDLVTFLVAVQVFGISFESNPIIRELWAAHGATGVIALKTMGVGGILVLLALLPPPWHTGLVAAVVAVAVFGMATNVASVVLIR